VRPPRPPTCDPRTPRALAHVVGGAQGAAACEKPRGRGRAMPMAAESERLWRGDRRAFLFNCCLCQKMPNFPISACSYQSLSGGPDPKLLAHHRRLQPLPLRGGGLLQDPDEGHLCQRPCGGDPRPPTPNGCSAPAPCSSDASTVQTDRVPHAESKGARCQGSHTAALAFLTILWVYGSRTCSPFVPVANPVLFPSVTEDFRCPQRG